MSYIDYIRYVSERKASGRQAVRSIIHYIIFLFVPIATLIQKLGWINLQTKNVSFWLIWFLFVFGWFVVLFANVFIAMQAFAKTIGRTQWDSLLFDRFYGYDVEIWPACLGYFGALVLFVVSNGIESLFSDIRVFGVVVLVSSLVSMVFTFIASRIVFNFVLYKR